MACRTVSKGEDAKLQVLQSVPSCSPAAIEVWQLDLGSYESVKAFAARANGVLSRLDSVVEGAGINKNGQFKMVEQDEQTITTNVVCTFLLALLLLPKLKETAKKHDVQTTLPILSSELSQAAKFAEQRLPQDHIFPALNDPTATNMHDRYETTKLIEVMVVRMMAKRLGPPESTPVIVTSVNPGLNITPMTDSLSQGGSLDLTTKIALNVLRLIGRKPEIGSRSYALAAEAGPEVHGRYMSDGVVARMAPAALGVEGEKVCEKVWAALAAKLEGIVPGVTANI